ncbi:hypothetical protein [Eubacterium sp. An3]|uniref:hypothetical protein n=1 Tax=Eubacterium sp. An3 TaxID=1965628 RepID=UPI000B367131|nr:hypothetical protein [Eubacterium sp. An3]OUO24938.1 hypothetical protein B5F87_18685 [Eubacterium sp. An3]
MPDWVTNFFGGFSIGLANTIWKAAMALIGGLLGTPPQDFSPDAWNFVERTLYPWSLSIGVSLLNLFFLIAICRAVSDLHHNITLEMTIEAFVKIVVANVIFLNLFLLMRLILSIAAAMVGEVFTTQSADLIVDEMDIGSTLFYLLFGIFFVLVAIVCSFLLLLTVYSRYIKIYLLIVLAPFALPTLIGGRETERTFYAWLKTFLLNAFEIVAIALTMAISFKIINAGISVFEGSGLVGEAVDGFWDALNALFTMIFMTASVKGVNSLLAKALAL